MYQKKQFATISTTSLPSEVSEAIVAGAIEQRKFVPKVRSFGWVDSSIAPGDATYIWNYLDALAAAERVAEGAEPAYDDAGATKGSGTITKIMKAFKVTWEADNLSKINVRVGQTRAAVDEIYDFEDNEIVDQLTTDAGNSLTGTDWSANTADPVKDIRNAKRLNKDDGFPSTYMILNPTNNEELDSVIASNTWYSVTEQTVRSGEPFPFMGLVRSENRNQATGTVLVARQAGNAGSFWTAEAWPLSVNIFDDNDVQSTKVQVFERVFPCATVRLNSVCKITGV